MIDLYPQIRLLHIALAISSGLLFALRGGLVSVGRSSLANHRLLRWLSYTIDTALLSAALLLIVILKLDISATNWLLVKLALLLAYILFGSLALRRAPTLAWRRGFFVLAIMTYVLIIGIARAHHPLGWFWHSPSMGSPL